MKHPTPASDAAGASERRDSSVETDLRAEFLVVLERRRAQLLRAAFRLTRSREDAEDIVQESLLKALTHLPRFRREAQLDTWLHAIVMNTARGWLRYRNRRDFTPLEVELQHGALVLPLDFPHPGDDPEESTRRRELRRLLRDEISGLNPAYGMPIVLCDLNYRSYREAANALHLSDTAIKSRLFRGRKLLRSRLAHHASRKQIPSRARSPIRAAGVPGPSKPLVRSSLGAASSGQPLSAAASPPAQSPAGAAEPSPPPAARLRAASAKPSPSARTPRSPASAGSSLPCAPASAG